jgi:hypothetical protein
MNKKINWIAAIIGICIGVVSCNVIIIRGNGNLVTSERNVSAFEKVNVRGSAEVYYHESQDYRAVVTIDENLANYVEIMAESNVLSIGMQKGVNYSVTKYKVDIYGPALVGVSVSGSGSFKNMDHIVASTFTTSVSGSGKIDGTVECENFVGKISGSGRINVVGNSKDADINISGSGRLNGDEFTMNNANVHISGSGTANICVSDRLKATISGSGRVNYLGEPTIESNISGSGRIVKR